MKYYGKEITKEVITKSIRPIEYLRCDKCEKKISPCKFRDKRSQYVRVRTSHNDWGRDSVDSITYYDLCHDCAAKFVSEYILKMHSTEELELTNETLWSNETCDDYDDDEIMSAEEDALNV